MFKKTNKKLLRDFQKGKYFATKPWPLYASASQTVGHQGHRYVAPVAEAFIQNLTVIKPPVTRCRPFSNLTGCSPAEEVYTQRELTDGE